MTTGTRNTVLGPTAAQGMRWRSVTMNRPGFYGTPSFWEGRLACLGSTVRIPGSKVVRLVVSMPELRDRVRGDQHGGRRLRVAAETLRQWIRQAESWTLTRAPGICCSARHDAGGKRASRCFPSAGRHSRTSPQRDRTYHAGSLCAHAIRVQATHMEVAEKTSFNHLTTR